MRNKENKYLLIQSQFWRVTLSLIFSYIIWQLIDIFYPIRLWDLVPLLFSIILIFLDYSADNQCKSIQKSILVKCAINYIEVLSNDLTIPPCNIPAIIKVLNESENIIFQICDCCDESAIAIHEESKGFIEDHKIIFQKHQVNKNNKVSFNDFIKDMSTVKSNLLKT